MTTKIFTGYVAVLFTALAIALIGFSFAYASEVTGTLSSDATNNTSNSGTLSGSVTSDNSGGSSGGGRSSSGGGSSNSPSGAVLGAATDNMSSPSFPNAGFAPTDPN